MLSVGAGQVRPKLPPGKSALEDCFDILRGKRPHTGPPRRRVSMGDLITRGLFPDLPLERRLPAPKLPDPARLDEDAPLADQLRLMVSAYRGAVWKKFGTAISWRRAEDLRRIERGDIQPAFQLKARGDSDDKAYRRTLQDLRAAAELMAAMGVPVAAWVSWRLDRWVAMLQKRRARKIVAPDITWVFNDHDIADHRGWFEKNLSAYMGGEQRMGPKHRDLIYRYHRLRIEVGGSGNSDPAYVRSAIAKHFPEGYSRAFAQAKAESARIQAELDARAARGEHLWA